MDDELLVAIGEAVVEMARLDLALAELICAVNGSRAEIGRLTKPPRARLAVNELLAAHPDWEELRDFRHHLFAAVTEHERMCVAWPLHGLEYSEVPAGLEPLWSWVLGVDAGRVIAAGFELNRLRRWTEHLMAITPGGAD